MIEQVYMAGSNIIKIRLDKNKNLFASSPKTGLQNFLPYTIAFKGLEKAKTMLKGKEKALKKAEKELLADEKWLKTHTEDEILKEIKKEYAKRGFRLCLQKKIDG